MIDYRWFNGMDILKVKGDGNHLALFLIYQETKDN